MSITQNIIDKLKNQGVEPDLNQIKLVNALSDVKFYSNFSLKRFFLKDNHLLSSNIVDVLSIFPQQDDFIA